MRRPDCLSLVVVGCLSRLAAERLAILDPAWCLAMGWLDCLSCLTMGSNWWGRNECLAVVYRCVSLLAVRPGWLLRLMTRRLALVGPNSLEGSHCECLGPVCLALVEPMNSLAMIGPDRLDRNVGLILV